MEKIDSKLKITDFDRKVYRCVSKIPLGQTRSYKWVAEKINKPKAFRAVGRALKRNPFPGIIPCHRVIKENGELGEYSGRGGKNKKKELIAVEKQIKSMIE